MKKNRWLTTTIRWWRSKIKGKGLQLLTPNKLLTKLPALLSQIKAIYKLKNELRQTYSLHKHYKSQTKSQQFNQVIKIMKVYTEDNKLVIMTVPKLFLLIWLKTLITACIMKMISL